MVHQISRPATQGAGLQAGPVVCSLGDGGHVPKGLGRKTLSRAAQSVGYGLSASAPVLFGALHYKTGNWAPVLAICGLLCAS